MRKYRHVKKRGRRKLGARKARLRVIHAEKKNPSSSSVGWTNVKGKGGKGWRDRAAKGQRRLPLSPCCETIRFGRQKPEALFQS